MTNLGMVLQKCLLLTVTRRWQNWHRNSCTRIYFTLHGPRFS